MRLDAVVRRQSTRITIINGHHQPSPKRRKVLAAVSNALHIRESGSLLAWAR
jgi:hypothetical protein